MVGSGEVLNGLQGGGRVWWRWDLSKSTVDLKGNLLGVQFRDSLHEQSRGSILDIFQCIMAQHEWACYTCQGRGGAQKALSNDLV